MFRMSFDRGCFGTDETKIGSVCLLTEGGLIHGRVFYVLYFFDRRCVVTGESKLCSVCVLTEGALVQLRVS